MKSAEFIVSSVLMFWYNELVSGMAAPFDFPKNQILETSCFLIQRRAIALSCCVRFQLIKVSFRSLILTGNKLSTSKEIQWGIYIV